MKKIPKIIWSYWNDEELPELVNLCLLSWKTNIGDYSIKLLNEKNIYKYIDVSDENKNKLTKLALSKQADYFRFCLLHKYGGIWVDATTFINKDLDFVHNSFKNDSELDVFFPIKDIKYNDYGFFMWENFFIASPKKTQFIKLLKNKFEEVYFCGGDFLKPEIGEIVKTGIGLNYHAVYWFYNELAKTNKYFRNQCCKQWFFSYNMINYKNTISWNIMKNHINYYKYNIPSNDVEIYGLYKIVSYVRNIEQNFLKKVRFTIEDFIFSKILHK
jgi:hypothetical protein